jgi:hypothetical protein
MVIEDFAPELVYTPRAKNVVANAISHLETSDTIELNTFNLIKTHNMFAFANYLANTKIEKQTNCNSYEKHSIVELANLLAADKLPDDIYPLNFKLIQKEQIRNTKLIDFAAKHLEYTLEAFHGGGKSCQLLCKNGNIVIP